MDDGMVSGPNSLIPNGSTAPGNVEPDPPPIPKPGIPLPVPMNGSTQRDSSGSPRANAGNVNTRSRQQPDAANVRLTALTAPGFGVRSTPSRLISATGPQSSFTRSRPVPRTVEPDTANANTQPLGLGFREKSTPPAARTSTTPSRATRVCAHERPAHVEAPAVVRHRLVHLALGLRKRRLRRAADRIQRPRVHLIGPMSVEPAR